jgi:hypothetical protein
MMMRRLTPILLLSALPALFGQSAPVGSIQGAFQTEDAKSATAVIRLAMIKPQPRTPVSVQTGPSGSFSFSGLEAGTYELCASVADGGYVDPCLWEASGVLVTLASGQAATGVTITGKKGSTFRVKVKDAGNNVKRTPDSALMIGVIAPGGRYYPLVLRETNGADKKYEITVPFDTQFYFTMTPLGLNLTDSRNSAVTSLQGVAFQHQKNGPAPEDLAFTVTGKK